MKTGDSVLVWSGPMACGARVLDPDPPVSPADGLHGFVWLDICVMGQHLPQSYKVGELMPLDAEEAPKYGLCPECLGFGTTDPGAVALAAGVDEIANPCPTCGGSGRPAMRVTIARAPGSVHGHMEVLDHEPVLLGKGALCLACGMAADEPLAAHV